MLIPTPSPIKLFVKTLAFLSPCFSEESGRGKDLHFPWADAASPSPALWAPVNQCPRAGRAFVRKTTAGHKGLEQGFSWKPFPWSRSCLKAGLIFKPRSFGVWIHQAALRRRPARLARSPLCRSRFPRSCPDQNGREGLPGGTGSSGIPKASGELPGSWTGSQSSVPALGLEPPALEGAIRDRRTRSLSSFLK